MKTSILLSALALSLAAPSKTKAQNSTAPATPAFVDRLVKEAVTTHPKTQAAMDRTEAARAAIGTVRLWEDPQAGLGYMEAEREMQRNEGDIMVSVDQMLPRPGLYKAERRRAEANYLAQGAAAELTANELGLAVAQAALELALSNEIIRLQAENIRWLETIVGTAEERAKNPDASATESLRLHSELATRQATLAVARRQRTQLARTLNILLGRGAKAGWEDLSLPATTPPLPNVAALRARLEKGNPQLEALRHEVEGAQADAAAATERRKPVFSAGVETRAYSGGDLRSMDFMFKMSLPWFNRRAYNADVLKAEQLRHAAQNDLAAQERELHTRLTELVTAAENNQQIVNAYAREVLPKTQQGVESLQNAWISSKATLLEVLDARRALLDAQQEQKRALAARHVAWHSLSALLGTFSSPQGK